MTPWGSGAAPSRRAVEAQSITPMPQLLHPLLLRSSPLAKRAFRCRDKIQPFHPQFPGLGFELIFFFSTL